ncbi:ribonuclease P protein component [Rhodoferax sp.]|uniref:ribonuclease P protein component n=1 Tax=Rhodoferax sp. TaxID=50421 RepID=UPI0008B4A4F0|nr:ribonuclease P protein component [Rhodoferax sp.]MDO8317893.1 ribonuclease P protein component [Rhodoferax sp.]MDP2677301.1 ribonuclease P protein component [Rhodoferax sp.]OGB54482.1 MAG: ribonuclease P protein component [Burkholderiales bacterium RIFOXYD12_FULL_59_19]
MQRLKSRRQFQAVLAGSTLARTPHFALHTVALNADPVDLAAKPLFNVPDVWLGAMVPKRWAKRAVTRNALKRQIYAVSDLYLAQLPAAAYVVRLRSGFDRVQFLSASSQALKLAARTEMHQLLDRATRVLPGAFTQVAA